MKPRIVVSRHLTQAAMAAAGERFDALLPGDADMDFSEALEAMRRHGAQGLLFATNLRLDAANIARLPPGLKIAATCSVGFDHIDVTAARGRGLVVTNTPGVLTECTADFAFLLLINAMRRAAEYARAIHAGWPRAYGTGEFLGRSLAGKTLGIVGMGRIGQALARRARAFGMAIAYHDERPVPAADASADRYFAELHAMLPVCDALSLHAPATPATIRMIDATALALLPRGAVLVNTARGALVDEAALFAALDSGQLAGAGLDVFENEPAIDTRFRSYPQLFITPHIASATEETRTAMGLLALDNIAAVLDGKPALTPV